MPAKQWLDAKASLTDGEQQKVERSHRRLAESADERVATDGDLSQPKNWVNSG